METYLDNCFIADYREGYISGIIDVCKPEPSPLRGWGRKSFYTNVTSPAKTVSFQFNSLGTIKGFGRLGDFYTKLHEFIISNKSKNKASSNTTYNYWRGAGKP